jgi:subtilisin family serine protease
VALDPHGRCPDLRWNVTPTPAFGTAEFTVNAQSSAITFLRFNFDNYTCGSITQNGSVGFGSTWPISDRQFAIDHSAMGDRFVFAGTFTTLGDAAAGTWELTMSGNTCSGTWEAEPVGPAMISGIITLSDQLLAPVPADAMAVARTAPPRETKQPPQALPALNPLPALPLVSLDGMRAREIPTDQLVVIYMAGPLAAPPVGSAALATPSVARTVAGALLARLEASLPVATDVADVAGVSPAILAARIRVRDVSRIDEVRAALERDPDVREVRPYVLTNWRMASHASVSAPATEPDDPAYPVQTWHYDMIDLPQAWDITTGSASVLVAVVDDGVRFDHPDLTANLTDDGWDFVPSLTLDLCAGGTFDNAGDGDGYDTDPTTPSDYEWDGEAECGTPLDLGSHGTHVAGTIGAVGNEAFGVSGVNWTVRIRPVRVIGVAGMADAYDVAQGILYAAGLPADNGAGGVVQAPSAARVINLSLGGPGGTTDLQNAVLSAGNAGALLVASAGNTPSSIPNYPAAYAQTISVSAVGPDTLLASYSSYGATIDIAAPGGDFQDAADLDHPIVASFGVLSDLWDFSQSTWEMGFAHGTSAAAPHVAGVAALLLAHDNSLTAAQLRARLLDYAVDRGSPGWDQEYGAGVVNARNSLTQTLAPPRHLYARLYNVTTTAVEATVAVDPDGAYAFSDLTDGDYVVYAGEDESGDQLIGVPGRRWGAHGSAATPTAITVAGGGNYPASFTVGFPFEWEPNNPFENANPIPLGAYLIGMMFEASDVFAFVVSEAGVYTVETSATSGACGLALSEDTVLELYDGSFDLIAENDDIDYSGLNWCSRVTETLQPGTYYASLRGWYGIGLPYRVQVRSGG